MMTAEAVVSQAFPMLGEKHLVGYLPGDEDLSHTRRRMGRYYGYRLVIGMDSGPKTTWAVWALAGRLSAEDEHDGFIVLNQLEVNGCAVSFQARLIADFHEATGYPKASMIFTGPAGVMQDGLLAAELDKRAIRDRLSLPSPGSSVPFCCARVARDGMGMGWATIAGLLNPPTGEPRLMFCPSAYSTYYELGRQIKGEDECHAVAALRYAVMGWWRRIQ